MGAPAQYKTNKILSKKFVYFEGTTVLHKGDILCYNYDSTSDMNGETVAEGGRNVGKVLRVEVPSTNNSKFPAGVVCDDYDGFTGPGWIDILEFVPGQIFEVRTDANCTAGTTVLYIANGKDHAQSSGAAALGLAMETIDRSAASGLILARIGNIANSAVSDAVVAGLSDIASALSNDVVQASNIAALVSNETADDSNFTVATSHITALRSNAVVDNSNLTVVTSHEVVDRSNLTAVRSNAVVAFAAATTPVETSYASNTCKKLGSDLKSALSNLIAKGVL